MRNASAYSKNRSRRHIHPAHGEHCIPHGQRRDNVFSEEIMCTSDSMLVIPLIPSSDRISSLQGQLDRGGGCSRNCGRSRSSGTGCYQHPVPRHARATLQALRLMLLVASAATGEMQAHATQDADDVISDDETMHPRLINSGDHHAPQMQAAPPRGLAAAHARPVCGRACSTPGASASRTPSGRGLTMRSTCSTW